MYFQGLKYLPTVVTFLVAIVLLVLIERISIPPYQWDRYLLSLAHGLRGFHLDRFFALITWAGSLFILIPVTALICGFLVRNGRAAEAFLLGLSLVGIALVSRLAKLWFSRPRPDLFPVIGEIPLDASYPSAHTAQIVAFSMAVCWILKTEKRCFTYYSLTGTTLLLAFLVALSRIYLQVHFPSDIVGGALLGLLWVLGLFKLLHTIGIIMR
ncbi:phosphatase PAP2 family protein [Methylicorpusculum oleiharenae]|uniref:phosphatase PAP2 family protein n=1 Tax=Methylicorpusculum oleiharenae TaxID=1338687 RepID=UPI00135B8071|nr:phosphatase PAP2 family protein [Methylicorpusculum oleiharenae]MCD2448828.1 phosphatase PAP2 family protein [Methylicorpusculum oleiharenae]